MEIVATYPHAADAFTQGLLYAEPWLYESTGLVGRSSLRRVELASGRVEQQVALPPDMFGEGLALVGDRLIQLSWLSERALSWNRESFALEGEFSYAGEGWGLCHDGARLVMSNGTSTLQLRDASTFELLGALDVHRDGVPIDRLNELECVNGEIFANVWLEPYIARIDGSTGEVTAWIDGRPLVNHPEIAAAPNVDVLNGIAYLPERDRWLLTGKLWPLAFEVEWVPAGPDPSD